ncbi:MAG: type II toxin-antitoxin system VapC family toxin [Phormidesmis sp.]
MSLWEISLKIKNKKLDLGVDIDSYLKALRKSDAVRIIPVNTDIWVNSVKLDWEHRDPADRVVVALAHSYQASIITADKRIRAFYPKVAW